MINNVGYYFLSSIFSETYTIEDDYDYDPMTSANNSKWDYPSTVSHTHSSNGVTLSASSWDGMAHIQAFPIPSSVEYEVTNKSSGTTGYVNIWEVLGDGNTIKLQSQLNSNNALYFSTDNTNYTFASNLGVYAWKIYSDKIEVYKDGNLVKSYSTSLSSAYILFTPSPLNQNFTFKNFKVKPL